MQQKTNTRLAEDRRKIAIVGFGDLGERLSGVLRGSRWQCLGLRRRIEALPRDVEGVRVDLADPTSLRVLGEYRPDALLVTLSPTERSEAGYRAGFADAMAAIVGGLAGHQPQRAFFVSSTRVYAASDGSWLDEQSPLASSDPFAASIIKAEECFIRGLEKGVILRAAGLYGSTPGPFIRRVLEGRRTPKTPLRYGNRIHRDDVAGFLAYMLDAPFGDRVINLVDDAPVAVQEVEQWLAGQLGCDSEVDEVSSQIAAQPSSVAYKRISNTRLHAAGYALQYPDYRTGYGPVLQKIKDAQKTPE